ncbi:MAG: hypothetical protein AAGD88_07190 [Bacteroidota bacterium]
MKPRNKLFQGIRYALLFLFFSGTTFGQTQLFSGNLTAGGYTGTAEYPFVIVDGDSIPDGSFLMYKSNVNALLQEKDSFFSFSGAFNNGYPTGFWKFQFGEFSSNQASQVVGYQYRINVSGVQHDAFGNLDQGRPDGDWTYKIAEVDNSEVSKVLFSSQISYDKGVPQKSFRIENDSSSLVGRFLRNGFAHDVWVVYSDTESEPAENWFFANGLLEKIEKITSEGNQTFPLFDSTLEQDTQIVLDQRYLKVLEWYLSAQDSEFNPEEMVMYQLLEQNATQYASIDRFFNDLGRSEFMPRFKVKVPYYPLDSLEANQLQNAKKSFEAANEISTSLLGNPQLDLLIRSNPEAQYYYDVVEKLQQDFLDPLASFLKFEQQQILTFLPQDELYGQIWPTGLPPKQIQLEGQSQEYASWVFETDSVYGQEPNDLVNIAQMADYANQGLSAVSTKLTEWLREEMKQQQFLQLDKQLVEETKKLEQRIDSLKSTASIRMLNALNGVLSTKEQSLKAYAQMEASDEKLEYGKTVLACLKDLNQLATSLGNLPNQQQAIAEKYQDAVWNPFTATIMDEEVKKRITAAYRNVIVPYALEKVAAPVSCDQALDIVNLLEDTQKRMFALRDESTSKLERKLRKEQDPETVLALLGIVSPFNATEQ